MKTGQAITEKIQSLCAQRALVLDKLKQAKKTKKRLAKQSESEKQAQQTAQSVAQGLQKVAHDKIATVVSKSLATVYDDPYTFKIDFQPKRGKTEAVLLFERNGKLIDPMTASGGGAIDVAAFGLRLSCLMLNQPPVRRTVILDEPFKFVSVQYRDNLKDMLNQLARELNIQFIMITHMTELETGRVKELK